MANASTLKAPTVAEVNATVMARLRAPFGCEFIEGAIVGTSRWRIHDANDDAIASVAAAEEGYARLIVQSLNEHFERREELADACEQANRDRDASGVEYVADDTGGGD